MSVADEGYYGASPWDPPARGIMRHVIDRDNTEIKNDLLNQKALIGAMEEHTQLMNHNLEEDSEKESLDQVPPAVLGPGPPMNPVLTFGAPVQSTLPPHLWPHDFLPLSLALSILFLIFNVISLIPAVFALGLSLLSKSRSQSGQYPAAKTYGVIALGLLTGATWFCLFSWITISVFFAVLIPALQYEYYG